MNAAILDSPPIEAPPLAAAPAPALVAVVPPVAALPLTIKETVLAQFAVAEKAVVALAEKYRAVAFDVTTTKGMTEAKAARQDLRENGRFLVQRAEKSVKDDVNSLKKVMADEVERIVGIVKPVEDAIDAQIKAEEERKAAAKAERERIEAERVAAHEAGIAKIRAYLAHCQQPGMTAERIGKGIDMLAAVTFGPEWQEFAVKAAEAQAETLTAMRELHTAAVEREAAAAQAEADRIAREAEQQRQAEENARVAAELAAQKAALDAQAAELAAREREAAFEAARLTTLKQRVADIHARAVDIEGLRSWDIFERVVLVEDLDVSEAAFQEFAPMAADARRLVLGALLKAKDAAEAREDAARVDLVTPAAPAAVAEPAVVVEDPCPVFVDDGAPIRPDEPAEVIEVATVATPAGADLFGAAPAQPAIAYNPAAELADCRAALTEALLLVQDLVNNMNQSSQLASAARGILARVAELRALGGI